jgi:hypothetical protein
MKHTYAVLYDAEHKPKGTLRLHPTNGNIWYMPIGAKEWTLLGGVKHI